MKTNQIIQVDLKDIDRSEKRWPDLYVRRGRCLIEITPDKASHLMDALCAGKGMSECRDLPLYDIDGVKVGHVSYNGRVWVGDGVNDPITEIPTRGQKTAAQHEAEGWADFKLKPA